MNDPHVVTLFYKIEHGPSVDYREAEPHDYEEEDFSVRIEDGKVCFTMKAHYATEEEAKEAVREYIQRWEFVVGLRRGPDTFKLVYKHARIEDRSLSRTANHIVQNSEESIRVSEQLTTQLPYPSPPSVGLTITPDVQSMFDRLMAYRSDREQLPGMANFWLTVLEKPQQSPTRTSRPDSRRGKAAKKYGIDLKVLDKIGNLSAKKGGPQGARKQEGIKKPLTVSETRFLEEAITMLTCRIAEVEHDIKNESYENKNLKEIKLSDFRRTRRP